MDQKPFDKLDHLSSLRVEIPTAHIWCQIESSVSSTWIALELAHKVFKDIQHKLFDMRADLDTGGCERVW